MTCTEITQAMEKLTEDIRTLSSSGPKAAAEKILHLNSVIKFFVLDVLPN
jgi:hypothetical protein